MPNHEYTGMFEFMESCKAPGKPDASKSSAREGRGRDWDYGVGFDGAMRLAAQGWPEGTEQVAALADKLLERIQRQTRRAKRQAGVWGTRPHIGRFLAGNPRNMIQKQRIPAKRPVKLIVNLSTSAAIDADVMTRRGAVAVASVQALTMAGYAVEVVGVMQATGKGGPLTLSIPLKQGSAPLDTDALSFAVAHPAFFRRLVFRAMEQHCPVLTNNCYGMPATYTEDGAITMPCLMYGERTTDLCRTDDGAFQYALEVLEAAGVTIDD